MDNARKRGMQRIAREIARNLETAAQPKPPSQVGFYVGHDAATGLDTVELPSGKQITGRFQTNGSVKVGQKVAVTQSRSGNLFDAMPR